MAKKQTRRSISINRALFDNAKAFAEASNIPLSKLTESALSAWISGNAIAPSTFATGGPHAKLEVRHGR